MHPLRQTSFPTSLDTESRTFSATSDAGSVAGSFTGSVGGKSTDGIFRPKKRGRKSKAEKERELQREDTASASVRGGMDASRFGSVDVDGSSLRGGAGGGAGAEEGEEEEDFDEGELLGKEEEGTKDTEAEKKNLAYVCCLRFVIAWFSICLVVLVD